MRISDTLVEKLLKKGGLTDAKIKALREQATSANLSLADMAVKNNVMGEKDLVKLYAEEIEVPYVQINAKEIKKETLNLLAERTARQYRAVVFNIDENGVRQVAMEDPDDVQARNFLTQILGSNVAIHITTTSLLQTALDQYRQESSGSGLTKVIPTVDEAEESEEVDESSLAEDSPIAKTVNLIIEYGVRSGASDVHIEPREDVVITRYRIDGVLHEIDKLPRKLLGALISRIKILANLKIDEHRAPQDGRFKVQMAGQMYALRVSTLPIVDGEKAVLRILNESAKAAEFNELGFWGDAKKTLESAIVQPHGMVLVTGPTGSGKSTTLFSVLSKINSPTVNISTVEDPVEYRIPGVNQTQVNPMANMTFTNGLRALLRQDPNIIMVGEVRDGETAELAVQAALTGHLVFTTLHTNDAATCLPRLLDMGVEPFLIASTVRVVIGQRLVRRLCTACREEFKPDAAQLEQVARALNMKDEASKRKLYDLESQALADGIGKTNTTSEKPQTDSSGMSSTASGIQRLWRARDGGCNVCNNTGYKGRIGIYEVLSISPNVQKLIINNGTSEQIQNAALEEHMLTMHTDGFIKVLRGETSVEEVLRVTAEG